MVRLASSILKWLCAKPARGRQFGVHRERSWSSVARALRRRCSASNGAPRLVRDAAEREPHVLDDAVVRRARAAATLTSANA